MKTSPSPPTLVLVHGAGDTAGVWADVQRHLTASSCAVDLLGRSRRPHDLSLVTLDLAVAQAILDIEGELSGPVVLVAHSIGGALSPWIVAGLDGRVVHLVHITAVAAGEGGLPLAAALPDHAERMVADAERLREAVSGATYAAVRDEVPSGLRVTTDQLAVTRVDSLNLGCVPTSWNGVDPALPRTYVQPLRDRLYLPDAQARLAAAMRADEIIGLDAGHNPARSAPGELAALLDGIVRRYASY